MREANLEVAEAMEDVVWRAFLMTHYRHETVQLHVWYLTRSTRVFVVCSIDYGTARGRSWSRSPVPGEIRMNELGRNACCQHVTCAAICTACGRSVGRL